MDWNPHSGWSDAHKRNKELEDGNDVAEGQMNPVVKPIAAANLFENKDSVKINV